MTNLYASAYVKKRNISVLLEIMFSWQQFAAHFGIVNSLVNNVHANLIELTKI